MQAILYQRLGGPDVLEVVDLPSPTPAPGEVLVEVEAAGVNFSDIGRRRGLYLDATPLPFVPGSEIVGRVRLLGPNVSSVAVGGLAIQLARCFGAGKIIALTSSPPTLDRLFALVAAGALAPTVGLRLPLARAAEAHAAMEGRTTMGKIALTVDGGRTPSEDEVSTTVTHRIEEAARVNGGIG